MRRLQRAMRSSRSYRLSRFFHSSKLAQRSRHTTTTTSRPIATPSSSIRRSTRARSSCSDYGPDVLYYIDRYGWEEDPALWTPFDEESAIKKGARYFISIEDNRLRRNVELCAWLQRFPERNANAQWPVYETDPAKLKPNADAFWRAFRTAESRGAGRSFLDAHGVCRVTGSAASSRP